jgi:hypothetical protein
VALPEGCCNFDFVRRNCWFLTVPLMLLFLGVSCSRVRVFAVQKMTRSSRAGHRLLVTGMSREIQLAETMGWSLQSTNLLLQVKEPVEVLWTY